MVGKETIGIRLTELASQFVSFYFSEAQTEDYPYAVYASSVTPIYTKDGIHHYEASVTVTVYAQDLETINPIAEQIASAVRNDMNDGQYFSRQLSDSSDCSDEVWSREMSFTIKQYR